MADNPPGRRELIEMIRRLHRLSQIQGKRIVGAVYAYVVSVAVGGRMVGLSGEPHRPRLGHFSSVFDLSAKICVICGWFEVVRNYFFSKASRADERRLSPRACSHKARSPPGTWPGRDLARCGEAGRPGPAGFSTCQAGRLPAARTARGVVQAAAVQAPGIDRPGPPDRSAHRRGRSGPGIWPFPTRDRAASNSARRDTPARPAAAIHSAPIPARASNFRSKRSNSISRSYCRNRELRRSAENRVRNA